MSAQHVAPWYGTQWSENQHNMAELDKASHDERAHNGASTAVVVQVGG